MASSKAESYGVAPANWLNQVMCSQGDGTGTTQQNVAVQTITGASDASPNVYTLAGHGYSDGDYVFIEGETGSTTANGLRVIANKETNTFELTDPAGTAINSDGTFAGTVTCALAFVYKPTSTQTAIVSCIKGYARDTASDTVKYLNDTAYTNGISVRLYTNDTLTSTLTAVPVKVHAQWALNAGATVAALTADTNDAITWTWNLRDAAGPIRLDGSTNQLIAVVIRDTLTGLQGQEMAIQGHLL